MEVDVKNLLVDLNFFARDMAIRNASPGRAEVRTIPDQLIDVAISLNIAVFPIVSWLKLQRVKTRKCLNELQAVSVDSYDGELYNAGEELLKRLEATVAPYTPSYVAFEELVKKTTHVILRRERPALMLMKLANHSYDLPGAVAAFHNYLYFLERDHIAKGPHIKALRNELEELEILSKLD